MANEGLGWDSRSPKRVSCHPGGGILGATPAKQKRMIFPYQPGSPSVCSRILKGPGW